MCSRTQVTLVSQEGSWCASPRTVRQGVPGLLGQPCRAAWAFLVSHGRVHPPVQKTRVQPPSWEDPLEKDMATHSSILAWRTPWTEDTGGLQSVGLQRVRHDGATNTLTLGRPCSTRLSRHPGSRDLSSLSPWDLALVGMDRGTQDHVHGLGATRESRKGGKVSSLEDQNSKIYICFIILARI